MKIIFTVIFLSMRFSRGQELNYKIANSEFICENDGTLKNIKNDITKIRVMKSNEENFDFDFKVNFERTGKNCRNIQRCNLMTWKTIRALETYLKSYPNSQDGLIEINNSMLEPGIRYLLNVTIQDHGKEIEKKQFTIDFEEETLEQTVKKPTASLNLLGSEHTYAFATYYLNGIFKSCSNSSSYYFNWELQDESFNLLEKLQEKGPELNIDPNKFEANNIYNIKCEVINKGDNTILATENKKINVLSKGISVVIPFQSLTMKTGEPISLEPNLIDFDNQNIDFKVKWSCVYNETENCIINGDNPVLNIEAGFSKEGRYQLTLTASKGETAIETSCQIFILNDVPTIEIENFETRVNPSMGVEIKANIFELKSSCTLQWASVEMEGFDNLDLSTVPGKVDDIITVSVKEDVFLNELEEFSNSTLDKSFSLILPPKDGSWSGLPGDNRYMFRLNVSCPIDYENFLNNQVESISQDVQSIFADVVVETNSAPKIEPLEVSPLNGEALKTVFNFTTQKAMDKNGDDPILYKFGYILGNREIIFSKMMDVTYSDTILPYTENGVKTFLEVCDIFGSCDKILGPTVNVGLPKDLDNTKILSMFNAKIEYESYHNAFVTALLISETYKYVNDEKLLKETGNYFSKRIGEEIQMLINMENKDAPFFSLANKLIKNVNDFGKELSLTEEIVNSIVTLRNLLSKNIVSQKLVVKTSRKLLNSPEFADNMNINLDDIKSHLEVSELTISRSNDHKYIEEEQENVKNQLDSAMAKMCLMLYRKEQKVQLELNTILLSVVKLQLKIALNSFLTLPFEKNSWNTFAKIKLGKVIDFKQQNQTEKKKFCIGKAVFKNYFGKVGYTYMAKIYSTEPSFEQPLRKTFVVGLPLTFEKLKDHDVQCLVCSSNNWKPCKILKQNQNFVQCSCNYLGYYYLEYVPKSLKPTNSVITQVKEIAAEEKNLLTTPINVVLDTTIVALNDTQNASTVVDIMQKKSSYDTISYVVIGVSIIGVAILAVVLFRVSQNEDDETILDDFEFPKYAQLYDEEMLTEAHI